MAMIFRRPGKTGIENLDAGKPADSFNGNNCQSSSNERKIKMKINSIIFCLCAGMCSSALIDNAFSMNNDKEMKNTTCKLDSYRAMISSKYFDSIQDFANLEMANPKFCDNIDKFHYNPISITPDKLHLWSHLETLHLYTDDDIDTWIKAQNDIDDLHKIEVWPCMSDKNAVKNMKELERFVAKSENHHATITFHNVTLTDPKILGKFNEDWKYTFNENVYTNGERKNANFVITSIGDSAFYECSGLTSITIPGSVISIGYGAFSRCTELASITMSNNISGLHSDTFYECGKVNFNVASEAMKKYLCSNCNIAEDKVTVDSSLYNEHYSWKWPEDGCIHFPADATRVADYMFCGRSDIKSVDLTNVTYIGVAAFEGCTGLSSIAIPNTVEYIDGYAFNVCDALTYVTIPNSVSSIMRFTFFTFSDQAKIKVASESMKQNLVSIGCASEYQIEVDTSLYGEQNAWKWPEDGHIKFPVGMTRIDCRTFRDRKDIKSIDLTNVTYIDEYAFEECTGLTSLVIPNTVKFIRYRAFAGCEGLMSVTIPNSVFSIEHRAFYMLNDQTKIKVASESMKQHLLSTDNASERQVEVDSSLYEEQNAWKWPENGQIQIPADITFIDNGMFAYRNDILSVTISASVTSIGEYAFYGCSGLTSITIPNSVITIDEMALGECEELQDVNVYSEVTKQLVIDSTPGINPDIIKVIE